MRKLFTLSLIFLLCTVSLMAQMDSTVFNYTTTKNDAKLVAYPNSMLSIIHMKNGKEIECYIVKEYLTYKVVRLAKYEGNVLVGFYESGEIKSKDIEAIDRKVNKVVAVKKTSIGDELMFSSTYKVIGTSICGVGIALIGIPYLFKEPQMGTGRYAIDNYVKDIKKYQNTQKALVLTGCGLFVAGSIFNLVSAHHLKVAGTIINLQAGTDGIGVKINLNK